MQTTRLRITATVRPDFLFSPGELEFQFGEDDEQVVTFRPGAMGKVALTEAYTTHRAFTAELRPETSEVCVTFDSSQWAELSKDAGLVVWLDSPNQPECRIPIDVSETRDGTRH